MRTLASWQQLLAPAVLVIAAALLGAAVSISTQTYFIDSLVKVSIVVALYVFIGNSGVLSFGHISFVALGAWTAGVLTVPTGEKPAIMPNLAHWLAHRTTGNLTSLALAALVGGVCAFVVGIPLMRLSGLAAGIATFAVLEITHNVLRYYEKIGPGLNTFSSVPETTDLRQAAIGALVVIVVAFAYARSRFGRLLRATREDAAAARAVGTSVYRQRLVAFAISGALAGLAGGLYVHLLPLNTEGLYLDLTFITLAMLVVGGAGSLFGAVVGALAVSALDSYLAVAENGTSLFGWHIDLPAGTRVIVVGVLMARRPDPSALRADRWPRVPAAAESGMTRICIAGAGAIGSLFAAHLARVAEVSALVRRPEHAQALREHGLRISGRADFTASLTAATSPDELDEPDLVIVACKGTDLDAVAAALAGHWPEATLMTVQNGIGADEIVARHGAWKLLTAVTFMSGTRHDDTHVEYVLDTATWIGPARGTTPDDARRVAALIVEAGLKAEGFDDLRPAQWSKLVFNATVNTVAALTGLPHDAHFAAVADEADLGHLVRDLMDEGKAVAAAAGVPLTRTPGR